MLRAMVNYKEARVKLTNSQLKRLESRAKYNTRTTVRIAKNRFKDKK